MASFQTLNLAHLPPDLAVHIALYTDLQNASFLRDQLLQGNPDFEYALIDASVVRGPSFLACLLSCLLAPSSIRSLVRSLLYTRFETAEKEKQC